MWDLINFWFVIYVYIYVYTYISYMLCSCRYVHEGVRVNMHVGVYYEGEELWGVPTSLGHPPSYFLRQCLSLHMELIDSATCNEFQGSDGLGPWCWINGFQILHECWRAGPHVCMAGIYRPSHLLSSALIKIPSQQKLYATQPVFLAKPHCFQDHVKHQSSLNHTEWLI